MSSTNRKQLEHLVNWMEKFKDIANCCSQRSREDMAKIWKGIEQDLNSVGPPVRSQFEWKKVWSDKKKYVRKKMAENFQNRNSIGGEPFREHKFTELEKAIIRICAMRSEPVEGLVGVKRFGLSTRSKKRSLDNSRFEKNISERSTCNDAGTEVMTTTQELLLEINSQQNDLTDSVVVVNEATRSPCDFSSTMNKKAKKDSCVFLEKEAHPIQELVDQISNAVKIMKTQSEKQCDIQKLLLEETKRHNLEIEKIKREELQAQKMKLELKRRQLEITEPNLNENIKTEFV